MNWFPIFFISLAMAVYGFIHSWMASIQLKKWILNRFPRFSSRYYRLFYSVFSVISLFPVLVMVLVLPDNHLYRIPAPLIYITLAVQTCCAMMLLIVLIQTDLWVFSGVQQALGSAPKKESFRADGIYLVVRHPAYSFGLLFLWLFPVMTTNILAFILSSTVYIFIGAVFEERKLLKQFPEYSEYRRRVPMFFPRLWKKTETN